jgi:hypothetical protein
MIEGQGLFQLAARNAAAVALSRDKSALHGHLHNVFERSEKPSGLASLTVDANTTIRAMFQAAWDKVHQDENLVSDDMLKRLEKASKSDNKEIAAERLRQAKAKLRSLRLQAQMAAASGDPKQLRHIAQQAAQAAREVAGAARGLAEGIAASAVPAEGAVPLTATGQDADSATTAPTTEGDPLAGAREELRKLGDEVHAAIAQARGLIAFAAQMARARRHHDEDFYRGLQRDVTEAGHDVDAALNAAGRSLDSGQSGAVGGVSTIETTTTIIQVTTEVTVTANIVV